MNLDFDATHDSAKHREGERNHRKVRDRTMAGRDETWRFVKVIWKLFYLRYSVLYFFFSLHFCTSRNTEKWKKILSKTEWKPYTLESLWAPSNAFKGATTQRPKFALDRSEDGWFLASSANSLFTILAVNKALKKYLAEKNVQESSKIRNKEKGLERPFLYSSYFWTI